MQLYKDGCNKLTLDGIDYLADEHGIIEVPDDKINSSVWTQGFVSAKGRIAELTAIQADDPAPAAAVDTPAAAAADANSAVETGKKTDAAKTTAPPAKTTADKSI